ncbi:MAG: superoxide dismutase, Fe-Mn family [Chloroflexota bacterium]|jgi:Fe-Mn family superoxide dismutase|nr:superoxide dismutase, Fe-Mn family [Chloroflexota bacterium]
MAQSAITPYKAADFSSLKGLHGLSDQQIEIHLGLYNGYVTNTNSLNEEIGHLLHEGKAGTPLYAELTRRRGFEYSGMILHEYYFGNLSPTGSGKPAAGSVTLKEIEASFGSWEQWLADFQAVGKMRGVGWAILFQDPATGLLSNHWVTLHQDGTPAGFKPILVMDVWEHAFMVDYKPAERAKYIEAFFSNINWDVVDQRLSNDAAMRPIGGSSSR